MNKKRKINKRSSKESPKENTWVEIIPYGIVGGMIPKASTMLFKSKKGEDRFVVWFSELQSRIAIEQSLNKERVFNFVQQILKTHEILPKYCFFIKRDQGRDVVRISFGESIKTLEFYADEVISFCMINDCRFFCTKEFFAQSPEEIPKRFKNVPLMSKSMYLN